MNDPKHTIIKVMLAGLEGFELPDDALVQAFEFTRIDLATCETRSGMRDRQPDGSNRSRASQQVRNGKCCRFRHLAPRHMPPRPPPTVGARAKSRFLKPIGITGTSFSRRKKAITHPVLFQIYLFVRARPRGYRYNLENRAHKGSPLWPPTERSALNLEVLC
jgi:hypothetical protein